MPNRQQPTRECQSPDWRRSDTTQPATRFADPLFSYSYELLFPQAVPFDNDPHCPGVYPACSLVPNFSALCVALFPFVPVFSRTCTLFFSLGPLFADTSLCFQWLA